MSEIDGGSIVVEVRADLARFDREGNAQANRFLKDIGVLRRKGASESLISELLEPGRQDRLRTWRASYRVRSARVARRDSR